MILDVGCGTSPKGHVNIDLFIKETLHRVNNKPINFKSIPNFIVADAHYLPFRDNIFETVCSHHVIEHLNNPTKAILEMLRVSISEVILVIPHRFVKKSLFRYKPCKMHKHLFNQTSITKWLKSLNLSFEIEVKYKALPHLFLPIIQLPQIIKIWIREKK